MTVTVKNSAEKLSDLTELTDTTDTSDTSDTSEVEGYLRGYLLNLRLIELDGYERKMFLAADERGTEIRELEADFDLSLAQARMFEIRHFVLSMPNTEEKLFLYYRYIRGQTVEICAELLGVSRSTAYRIKDRALAIAAKRYAGMQRMR